MAQSKQHKQMIGHPPSTTTHIVSEMSSHGDHLKGACQSQPQPLLVESQRNILPLAAAGQHYPDRRNSALEPECDQDGLQAKPSQVN